MFRVRISLALLVLAGTSCAQSWCPPGAEWISYPPMGWPVEGYSRLYYAGDTLLGNLQGQRLAEQHAEQSWGSSYVYQYHNPVAHITAVEDGVVLLWSTTLEAWDTLFWFGAVPGDHWQRPHVQFIEGGAADRIEVLDTGLVLLEGVPLSTLDVQVICDVVPEFYTLTITERLGTGSVLHLPDGCAFDSFAWDLRCYSDNEIDVTYGSPCDVFLSIATSVDPGSGPFPNPGTDHFTLTLPPGPHTVVLVDATGRVVLRQRANDQLATIDVTQLLPGIYGVRVDGGPATLLWVKE